MGIWRETHEGRYNLAMAAKITTKLPVSCPHCGARSVVLRTEGATRLRRCLNPDCAGTYKTMETLIPMCRTKRAQAAKFGGPYAI